MTFHYLQMKETFSKSSVSCLMRANLRTIKGEELKAAEEKDDPCWQVTQQLHFLIEKVSASERPWSHIAGDNEPIYDQDRLSFFN